MAKPTNLIVKESFEDLKKYLKTAKTSLIRSRILFLIETKKNEPLKGINKNDLALKVGVNHNTITSWRKIYSDFGIQGILKHGRTGFKPCVLTNEEHLIIEKKLNDPQNNLVGYTELKKWLETEYNIDIKYTTLNEYCKRNFKTKIKTARKSHIKKDENSVETFKKTLVKK